MSNPGVPVEITDIHVGHGSQAERLTHYDSVKGIKQSEIESLLNRSKSYSGTSFSIPAVGSHPVVIHAGSKSLFRVKNNVVEHAVPSIDGVFARTREMDSPSCVSVGGHKVCKNARIPEMLCYVDPTTTFRPHKVEGSLVCRNSTTYESWLGEEHLDSAILKRALERCRHILKTSTNSTARTVDLQRCFKEAQKESFPAEKNAILLPLSTGIREMTAARVLQRSKALAEIKRSMLRTDGTTRNVQSGWISTLLQRVIGWNRVPDHENHTRKELADRFLSLTAKALISSNWWNAVDDCQFLCTEILPVVEAVSERAQQEKGQHKKSTRVSESYHRFRRQLVAERNRLVQIRALVKREHGPALVPEQEALLIEYSRFLAGIQQRESEGMVVDISPRFLPDPRKEILSLLASTTLCQNPHSSPNGCKRNADWLVSVLDNLCDWNRLVMQL
eukprot:CAMPEP_0201535334 /NCGR_PEP_ID=MMETSP0161_2-20130828/58716_1 /ASSEMBLY_ACC=CAM_ASM_000251 /TAXON_ID=180227 /ORGANISM="Neoparamoeba aestuarina, Strain SoJaBio B1-5/56/2" /LENGTH=446 /DNA_ID=CAMNT_0047940439 /DNA_START=68 /DNA_END=1404 /DNA_ORIENTATION=-